MCAIGTTGLYVKTKVMRAWTAQESIAPESTVLMNKNTSFKLHQMMVTKIKNLRHLIMFFPKECNS